MTIFERSQVDDKYKWNKSYIFSTVDDAFALLPTLAELYKKQAEVVQKDSFLSSEVAFKEFIDRSSELHNVSLKLSCYMSLWQDEDLANKDYMKLQSEIKKITDDYRTMSDQVVAALLKPGVKQKVLDWLEQDEAYRPNKRQYEIFYKEQKHILSKREEELLSRLAGGVSESEVQTTLLDKEIPNKTIVLSSGVSKEISYAAYQEIREQGTTEDRYAASEAFLTSRGQFQETMATLMSGFLEDANNMRKVRKYKSSLSQALESDEIPVKAYSAVIKAANSGRCRKLMKNIIQLKRKNLGLKEIRYIDLWAESPATNTALDTIQYEDAVKMVLEATSVMGEDYTAKITEGLAPGKWVDVYPTENKTSGAYCQGCDALPHPYVLMNYQNTYESVSTLAHELGHAMHSVYTNTTQHHANRGYTTFIAEIASTTNENLLLEKQLETADKEAKKSLLDRHLNTFRSTFYRQAMFAEFELLMYERAAKLEPMPGSWFCDTYLELVKKYYGDFCIVDDFVKYEWMIIPHFYYGFYVFQYATGVMLASTIANKIRAVDGFAQQYIDHVLSAGSSVPPFEMLKKIGIDPSKSACYNDFFDGIEEKVKMLASLLRKSSDN